MKKWLFGGSLVLTWALVSGCVALNADQSAQVDRITAQIVALKGDYERIRGEVEATVAKVQAGELSLPEGLALVQRLTADADSISGKVATLTAEAKAVSESGAPWWMVLGSVALNLATGGAFVKVKGSLGTALQAAGALSRAFNTATGGTQGKVVSAEIADSPGLTREYMNDLRELALAKEV